MSGILITSYSNSINDMKERSLDLLEIDGSLLSSNPILALKTILNLRNSKAKSYFEPFHRKNIIAEIFKSSVELIDLNTDFSGLFKALSKHPNLFLYLIQKKNEKCLFNANEQKIIFDNFDKIPKITNIVYESAKIFGNLIKLDAIHDYNIRMCLENNKKCVLLKVIDFLLA
jgi:hypothetical protein